MSEGSPYAGDTAIVFGGTSGIGAATALLLAERSPAVTVVSRREPEGEATAERCRAAGAAAQYVAGDVTDDGQVAAAVATATRAHGPLTMAVNSAGTDVSAPFTDLTDADVATLFLINTEGLWRCVKHEIAAMVETGRGSIVNVNSIASLVPVLGNSLYGASKNAVTGITQSAAYEYAAAGIRVNETAPGTTRTQVLEDFLAQSTGDTVTAEQLARCVALAIWPNLGSRPRPSPSSCRTTPRSSPARRCPSTEHEQPVSADETCVAGSR